MFLHVNTTLSNYFGGGGGKRQQEQQQPNAVADAAAYVLSPSAFCLERLGCGA